MNLSFRQVDVFGEDSCTGNPVYTAAQGTAMGRRGRIYITTEGDTIWVGGRADVVLSGTATL
jgi:predicted PhzF superfamily epimerase YddE/YHI9